MRLRSVLATLLGVAYLTLALTSLLNWAADRWGGGPVLGSLGPLPAPSSLGLFIPLFTVGILYASSYYYWRSGPRLEFHAVLLVASILSLSLSILELLLGFTEFLDHLVKVGLFGAAGGFDPGVFAELEIPLGLLSIPILRVSLRELRSLRGS